MAAALHIRNEGGNGMEESKFAPVWFITGTSSGFGLLLAEEALKRGERVIATARDVSKLTRLVRQYPDRIRCLTLDVTKPDEIASVAQQAVAAFGHVDILVNNAGYGLNGAIEEVSEDEFEPMFQTNIYGLIRVTRALLPHFRQRRSGHIFNLSSIGGLIGSAGWGFYNVTKFAVEGFSEALSEEMKPLGVHVTVVEPGPFRTDFLGRSGKLAKRELSDYATTAGKAREYLRTQSGKQPGDPQKAVAAIVALANSSRPPLHLVLGRIALSRFRNKLASWEKEIAEWETISTADDFPENQNSAAD